MTAPIDLRRRERRRYDNVRCAQVVLVMAAALVTFVTLPDSDWNIPDAAMLLGGWLVPALIGAFVWRLSHPRPHRMSLVTDIHLLDNTEDPAA